VSTEDGLVREPVGHNRKEAERRLRAVEVRIDQDTFEPVDNVPFSDWCDVWLGGLRRKETTRRTYRSSLEYAKQAIGQKPLRKVTTSDVRGFLDHIERVHRLRNPSQEMSSTTLAKHLRHLGACLQAAKLERRISENPVRLLAPSAKPKAKRKRPSYFTNDELARLWPRLAEPVVISYLCRLAVLTGMRFGELAALRWDDVDLRAGEIVVARTYSPGIGETETKNGEPRTVDLVPQGKQLLEKWYPQTRGRGLVFESVTGGYLDGGAVLDTLYDAMKAARVRRVSERGGKRTFHSYRHTFARITLENGAQLEWVQAQLGHSTITLTRDLYGSWSRKAEKLAARRLKGKFVV
jgi:integrase